MSITKRARRAQNRAFDDVGLPDAITMDARELAGRLGIAESDVDDQVSTGTIPPPITDWPSRWLREVVEVWLEHGAPAEGAR